jgi:hypothetical protein
MRTMSESIHLSSKVRSLMGSLQRVGFRRPTPTTSVRIAWYFRPRNRPSAFWSPRSASRRISRIPRWFVTSLSSLHSLLTINPTAFFGLAKGIPPVMVDKSHGGEGTDDVGTHQYKKRKPMYTDRTPGDDSVSGAYAQRMREMVRPVYFPLESPLINNISWMDVLPRTLPSAPVSSPSKSIRSKVSSA